MERGAGRSFLGLDAFPMASGYVERLEQRPAFQAALADAKLAPSAAPRH